MTTSQAPSTKPILFALGLLYFHFGFLKLFPDLSGAEMLAGQTIMRLPLGIGPSDSVFFLGLFECTIGALLLFGLVPRIALVLFFVHMAGTFIPLFVLPELAFKFAPFAPTLEGQYVIKNIVFVAAGWVAYRDVSRRERAVRGERLVLEAES